MKHQEYLDKLEEFSKVKTQEEFDIYLNNDPEFKMCREYHMEIKVIDLLIDLLTSSPLISYTEFSLSRPKNPDSKDPYEPLRKRQNEYRRLIEEMWED